MFYGSAPTDPEALARIRCAIIGFCGENDARITARLPATQEAPEGCRSRVYDAVAYTGAGHGCMRSGEAPDASEAHRDARDRAWKRWLEFMR